MLRLFNSMGRKLEAFTLRDAADVRMYVCGPTLSELAALGVEVEDVGRATRWRVRA